MRICGRRALFLALSLVIGTTAPVRAGQDVVSPTAAGPEATLAVMQLAADWQLAHPSGHAPWDWTQAAFYTGVTALMDVTDEPRYEEALRRMADANQWRPGPRPGHADDHAVLATYARLFETDRDERTLQPARALFDFLARYPYAESLAWGNAIETRELAWCDALFMGPPPLAALTSVTGDRKYLDLANRLWWKTTDYLYDPAERLYLRDSKYFDQREPNGRKVFWSRGNGWVLSGLARMLQEMPEDYPDRPRYLTLFRDMASRIAELQGEDGYWRASLLDPMSRPNPESSGTGFFVHGLAWGINRGLLDRARFEPHVRRGWAALLSALHPDGKLGWVQPIGQAPGATSADETEVYGVGGFLLAGSEVLKMAVLDGSRSLTVTAANGLDEARFNETIEVEWKTLAPRLAAAPSDPVFVFDGRSGRVVPSQLFDANGDGTPDRLLFQSSFLARDRRSFEVRKLARPWKRTFVARTHGRFVPERKDDFAWENDRMAYRMYGPALAATGEISSGIDVWAKRVRRLVVDEWYKKDDYHVDHGDGLDFYKVGPSRGCGGLALLDGAALQVSSNFRSWKLLADGPVRVAFALSYDAWGPTGMKVTEEKVISLDAGQSLNRIESRFTSAAAKPLAVAVGIVTREAAAAGGVPGQVIRDEKGRYVGYFEPPAGDNGQIGCGIVFESEGARTLTQDGQVLLSKGHDGRLPFAYRSGATWSKGRDARSAAQWEAQLQHEARRAASPIRAEVQTP
jgi:rhamnogalacturonyl hydrolase YesR